jgi:hypothetical protein
MANKDNGYNVNNFVLDEKIAEVWSLNLDETVLIMSAQGLIQGNFTTVPTCRKLISCHIR